MKRLFVLLLAAVMCFSLAACGNNSKLEKYEKYETMIDYMEAGDFESALAEMIKISGNAENAGTQEDGKQNNTQPSEAEPVEQTIELTLDNWQEYFEIRPNTYGALYDSFGKFERLDYVNWAMFLKSDVADKVTELEDVAIEYSFRDGYFCWFEYNLDTKEFVQKNAAAEGEVDSWLKVEDSNRDLQLSLYGLREKNGCFLVFINKHLSDSLNDNIYSFIGEAYETMEIVKIKGTITISE